MSKIYDIVDIFDEMFKAIVKENKVIYYPLIAGFVEICKFDGV